MKVGLQDGGGFRLRLCMTPVLGVSRAPRGSPATGAFEVSRFDLVD